MLQKRYIGLDIFRIICFLVVCAFHTTIHLGCDYGPLQGVSIMGAMFMTAFFMMSGFTLNINYNKVDLKEFNNIKIFFVKRIIGIIPMYYVCAILFVVFRGNETTIQNILLAPIELLGIQATFSSLFSYTHNGGTWFVSCILICYLLYPYIQEILKQTTIKIKIYIIIVLAMILLYTPIVVNVFDTESIYTNPFFRCLEFIIGVTLASMFETIKENIFIKKLAFNWIAILCELFVFALAVSIGVKFRFQVGNYMLYSWIGLPLFICMLISYAGVNTDCLENNKIYEFVGIFIFSCATIFKLAMSRNY